MCVAKNRFVSDKAPHLALHYRFRNTFESMYTRSIYNKLQKAKIRICGTRVIPKRSALMFIGSLFDPLELIFPFTLQLKLLPRPIPHVFSGTCREKVTQDYIRRLHRGWDSATIELNNAISKNPSDTAVIQICKRLNETDCHDSIPE